MKTRDYSLANVIDHRIEKRLADMHTAIPGRVLAYNAATQKADIQPLVQVSYVDEDDETITVQLPVVTDVPVMFPGAGGYRITFPVRAGDQDGDTVLLVFAESSIDTWLANGGIVDPRDDRRFHLTDGIALLGLRDYAHALASASTSAMTIGDDAGLQIFIDGSKVKIGSNAALDLDAVALATATTTALNNIVSWLTAHTHPVAGAVAGVSVLPPPNIPVIGSGVVEVKK